MRIREIELANYRNHESISLTFEAGSTTIIGRNGRGKTNIIEAINYLATLGSHRVAHDAPLILIGQTSATISAVVQKQERTAAVSIDINDQKPNRVTLNGNQLTRPKEIIGLIHTVVFAPEDLQLVSGDPSARRKYLDDFATQRAPRVLGLRHDFDKVLRQRNALLKSAGRRPLSVSAQETLDVWDEQYVDHASALVEARLVALDELSPWICEHGEMISASTEPLEVKYSATWLQTDTRDKAAIKTQLTHALHERYRDELERGVTLVGPHRDDIDIQLSAIPAKGYASHGQSWSIALALRLATFNVLREFEDDPILLLDDVFAELDVLRRTRLVSAVTGVEQTIITAAVPEDVPQALLDRTYALED